MSLLGPSLSPEKTKEPVIAAPYVPPNYLQSTHVLPKGVCQENDYDTAYDSEAVRMAFTPASLSCGIRTLPNAMQPEFRSKMLLEIMSRSRSERTLATGSSPTRTSGSLSQQPSLRAEGEKSFFGFPPIKEHPEGRDFTHYPYLSSEYDLARDAERARQAAIKAGWAKDKPADFNVPANERKLTYLPTFSPFEYTPEPYSEVRYKVAEAAADGRPCRTLLPGCKMSCAVLPFSDLICHCHSNKSRHRACN